MLKYIELKTGFDDDGPAWIADVTVSKSGRTIYFNGMALKRAGASLTGSYLDVRTRDEYWVAGVKRRGTNRHRAGPGPIMVAAAAVPELLAHLGEATLDTTRFVVTDSIEPTGPADFHGHEHPTGD